MALPTDPRLGYRNGSGDIQKVPTQYADGSSFNSGLLASSDWVWLDVNNFVILPPTQQTLTSGQQSTLSALAGTTTSIGSYASLISTVEATAVGPLYIFDHFKGSTFDTATWNTDVNGTSAAVAQANTSGISEITLVTGTDDNGHATLTSDLSWNSSENTIFVEARIRISAITNVSIEFGFNDAATESGGQAWTSYDATPVAVTTDGAVLGFLHDAGAGETNTNWSALSRNNGGTAVRTDTSTAPTAATWIELAVALTPGTTDADAAFFINGELVASQSAAVNANVVIYPWLSVSCKAGAASRTIEVDWMRVYLKGS